MYLRYSLRDRVHGHRRVLQGDTKSVMVVTTIHAFVQRTLSDEDNIQ